MQTAGPQEEQPLELHVQATIRNIIIKRFCIGKGGIREELWGYNPSRSILASPSEGEELFFSSC